MVQNRQALDHVTLLLKPIKAGLRPMFRITVASVRKMERWLVQNS
jgi:hypothetical protein